VQPKIQNHVIRHCGPFQDEYIKRKPADKMVLKKIRQELYSIDEDSQPSNEKRKLADKMVLKQISQELYSIDDYFSSDSQ
jgi:hypothetical protein